MKDSKHPYLREYEIHPGHFGMEICDPDGKVIGTIKRKLSRIHMSQDAWVVYLNDADREY
jgi:hypothetical protein